MRRRGDGHYVLYILEIGNETAQFPVGKGQGSRCPKVPRDVGVMGCRERSVNGLITLSADRWGLGAKNLCIPIRMDTQGFR